MNRVLSAIAIALLLASCDTVRPDESGTLVVEAYVESGAPLPPIRVTRTRLVTDPEPDPVIGAVVVLEIRGLSIPYESGVEPGLFRPSSPFDTVHARTGEGFRVAVDAGSDRAEAIGTVPPPLGDISISLDIPVEPVEAVLLDSLSLPLDSLQFELPSRTGYGRDS